MLQQIWSDVTTLKKDFNISLQFIRLALHPRSLLRFGLAMQSPLVAVCFPLNFRSILLLSVCGQTACPWRRCLWSGQSRCLSLMLLLEAASTTGSGLGSVNSIVRNL